MALLLFVVLPQSVISFSTFPCWSFLIKLNEKNPCATKRVLLPHKSSYKTPKRIYLYNLAFCRKQIFTIILYHTKTSLSTLLRNFFKKILIYRPKLDIVAYRIDIFITKRLTKSAKLSGASS